MTWTPGPVVTRRRLGGELKRLRVGAGLKLEDVARELECSPSKVSRLENGKGIPRSRDVRDMLELYGVPDGDPKERLLEWSRTGQQSMWWSEYADVLPLGLDTYVELEWDASEITAFEPHVVHGLLQTTEYAHTVLTAIRGSTHEPEQIGRLVEVRKGRQKALEPAHGLTFTCVLDESALYRVVGSWAVLEEQLKRLLADATRKHVDLRILPFEAGLAAFNAGPFAKMNFSEGIERGLIHVEQPASDVFVSDPDEMAVFESRLKAIVTASLPESASIRRIEAALQRCQGSPRNESATRSDSDR